MPKKRNYTKMILKKPHEAFSRKEIMQKYRNWLQRSFFGETNISNEQLDEINFINRKENISEKN